jgi:hypothetical protein
VAGAGEGGGCGVAAALAAAAPNMPAKSVAAIKAVDRRRCIFRLSNVPVQVAI